MVRGSGDPPKPETRKSIGCPVYPISQCLNVECVKKPVSVGTLSVNTVSNVAILRTHKRKGNRKIFRTLLYLVYLQKLHRAELPRTVRLETEWTSDPFAGVFSHRFYRAFLNNHPCKKGAAILLETHLSAERRSGSRCRWLNRRSCRYTTPFQVTRPGRESG